MKTFSITALLVLSSFSFSAIAQKKFNNKPLLMATTERADISIGKEWYQNRWRISPQIERDSMKLALYSKSESFGFRTDRDSVRFMIKPGETKSFYVKLGEAAPAYTLISAEAFAWDKVEYLLMGNSM